MWFSKLLVFTYFSKSQKTNKKSTFIVYLKKICRIISFVSSCYCFFPLRFTFRTLDRPFYISKISNSRAISRKQNFTLFTKLRKNMPKVIGMPEDRQIQDRAITSVGRISTYTYCYHLP